MKAIRIFVVCCAVVLCATSSFAATWTATQIGDASNLSAAGGTILTVYNNNLYAAALTNTSWGDKVNPLSYNGVGWTDTGLADWGYAAMDFQELNGALYMTSGGKVFSSTGTGWAYVTQHVANYNAQLAAFNGNLIIGSTNWGKMWSWDGSALTQIGRLNASSADLVGDVYVYNGMIYAGNANYGRLQWSDGSAGGDGDVWANSAAAVDRTNLLDSIVEWNGGLWAGCNTAALAGARLYQFNGSALSENSAMRLPVTSSSIDLEVMNGTLYAAVGYKSQVYEWTGSSWSMIAELSADAENRVDLQSWNGNLYAGLANGGEVFEIATIPEPSLMMSAVAGLLLIIRRKR